MFPVEIKGGSFLTCGRHLCELRHVVLAIGMILVLSNVCDAQIDFRSVVESFRRDGEAVLYSECAARHGKALLLITLTQNNCEVWLFELEEGWLVDSAQVVPTATSFELANAPAGEGNLTKMRRYMGTLLKGPFGFLPPSQTVRLISSVPQTACAG